MNLDCTTKGVYPPRIPFKDHDVDDSCDFVLARDRGATHLSWCEDVVEWSMHDVSQPGRLVRVQADGHEYAAYGRILAIKKYLEDPDGRPSVWLLDPDFMFVGRAIVSPRTPGHSVAEAIDKVWYKDIIRHSEDVVRRFSKSNHLELSFTIAPWGISREDLGIIIDRWVELCLKIWSDEQVTKFPIWNKWLSDMWAYWIACAEYGLSQREINIVGYLESRLIDRPIIHFCHNIPQIGGCRWSKKNYVPWEPVDGSKTPRNLVAARHFLDCLGKIAASQRDNTQKQSNE